LLLNFSIKNVPLKALAFFFIIILTILISLILGIHTYYINYWPTDSEYPYLPTAAKLFELQYISDIHDLPWRGVLRVNMHGKETLILGIAIMQKLLNDYLTLYPNVLLLIIAVGLSAILIYWICDKLFDAQTALIIYFLFVSCFWPYLYVIMGAHPPLGLVTFLLATSCLLRAFQTRIFYLFSGFSLGLMLFSTPTAPLYLPYYVGLFIFLGYKYHNQNRWGNYSINLALIILGILSIFLVFTWPNPLSNLKDYFEFMQFSRLGNNFRLYKNYLERFFPVPEGLRGGGWLWIIQYAFLIMPVIFPLYLMSIIYILYHFMDQKIKSLIVVLTLLTPVLIEASGVVQFGRNYFSWYMGILFIIALAFYHFKNTVVLGRPSLKKIFVFCTTLFLSIHVIWNVKIYCTEIFPSRLVTTYAYNWCRQNNVRELFTYKNHPLHPNIIKFFNNPKHRERIKFKFIDSTEHATEGYILVPPMNGKTIYGECRFDNFYPDPYITELYITKKLDQFVVASFPSMAVSKIWNMEEEICAYRDLILGQVTPEDRQKGYVWILDAQKLQKELFVQK